MPDVYIGFGSNIGNRLRSIVVALKQITEQPVFTFNSISSIYETEPVGFKNQEDFLNGVVCVYTDISANSVLDHCQNIEHFLGRRRDIRWGPRIIDLDILLYGSQKIETERLTIPHAQLRNRRFVLAPLLEIAQHIKVPGTGKTVERLYNECDDNSQVRCVYHSERLAKKLNEE